MVKTELVEIKRSIIAGKTLLFFCMDFLMFLIVILMGIIRLTSKENRDRLVTVR